MMPTDPDPKVDNRFRWLPTAAKHYHLHKEQGTSIRTIARSLGCHASTVSRQVRRIERMRDDPAVKATLDKLKHVQPLKSAQQPHKSEPEDARILRLLGTKGAVLVLAENMHKALIVCEEPPQTATPIGRVSAEVAQALAMQGLLRCVSSGKLSRFILALSSTSAPGQAKRSKYAAEFEDKGNGADTYESKSSSAGATETPLAILARRRDKSGKAFLFRALISAGQRLREDFEIGQLVPCDHGTWDQCLLTSAPEAALSKDPRQREAVERVAAALRELGPGLGDVALKCCCYLEGLEVTEKTLGWSARSGKIVLRIALQRLKRHYEQTFGPGGGQIH